MKMIKIEKQSTIDGKKYTFEFICNWHDTRGGFAHDCNLFINNIEKTVSHCYYINRTWEVYTFQSVCMNAICNVINEYTDKCREIYLDIHGYKRMTQKRKTDFNDFISHDDYLNMLKSVKDDLQYHVY